MGKLIIQPGTRFGCLTYLKDSEKRILPSGQKTRVAYCLCDCGNYFEALLLHLVRNRAYSCGCSRRVSERESVIGQKYGTLTIVRELLDVFFSGREFRMVEAVCECGAVKEFRLQAIKRLKSCGCLTGQLCGKKFITHGLSKHRLYSIWMNLRNRCYNKNVESYQYYGARGVKVCDEWQQGFVNFYTWAIKNGYSESLSIDRFPDTRGDYEPSNCRWATDKQQQNNKTTNRLVEYKGETMTLTELAEKYNINYKRLHSRINSLGWSLEDAVEKEIVPMLESLKRAHLTR